MREYVHGPVGMTFRRFFNDGKPVLPDAATKIRIFVGNGLRLGTGDANGLFS